MTINFQIRGHPEEYVKGQLDSGRYTDATDVVVDALRQMEERQRENAAIRAQIAAGMRDLREGRHCDGDEFMAQLDAELDALDREAK